MIAPIFQKLNSLIIPFLTILVLVTSSLSNAAENPALKQLRNRLPGDLQIVIEIQTPKTNVEKFLAGDLYSRLSNFGPIAKWKSTGGLGVQFLIQKICIELEMPWEQIRDELLDSNIILAAQATDTPTDDDKAFNFLVAIQTENQAALEKLVAGFHKIRKSNNEISNISELTFQNHTYSEVTTKNSSPFEKEYFAVHNGVLVVSSAVANIEYALNTSQSDQASWQDTLASVSDQPLLNNFSFVNLFIIGEGLQPWLEVKATDEDASEDEKNTAVALKEISQVTKAIAIGLDVEDSLKLSGEFVFNSDATQQHMGLIKDYLGPSEFLQLVPNDAMFVAAGRVDIQTLVKAMYQAGNDQEKSDMLELRAAGMAMSGGLDFINDVVASLGPNFGLYIAPTLEKREYLASDIVAAIEIKQDTDKSNSEGESVHEIMNHSVRSLLTFLALYNNHEHPESNSTVKSSKKEDFNVTWAEGLADIPPSEAKLAYSIFPEGIAFSSSVKALERLSTIEKKSVSLLEKKIFSDLFKRAEEEQRAAPTFVLYFNGERIRTQLTKNSEQWSEVISKFSDAPKEKQKAGMRVLSEILKLNDEVLFSMSLDPTKRSGFDVIISADNE